MREVVVTGGGTGIGYAIAEHFVAAGDRVTITGRRPDVLAAAAGRLGAGHTAFDASDPAEVTAALDVLPRRVDVLVNNAGANNDFVGPPPGSEDLTALAEGWYANLASNLMTAVLVTAALLPRLPDGGRVVTVGSVAARQGGGSYAAAKAGLEPWNLDLTTQLGRRGITANIVAPGLVLDTDFFGDVLTDGHVQRLVDDTQTGRAGRPRDVAEAVAFLASPGAAHITGQVVFVNGGAFFGE